MLQNNEKSSWCYLFLHRSHMSMVMEKLEKRFRVFVHKSLIYTKGKGRVQKAERPTISGLVFIQGDSREIQTYLSDNFFGLYLINNCSTRKVATIPDRVMQPFMQVSRLDSHRIRFMPHPFDYYSSGHALVRVTSGPLVGLEGYEVRISRDKCLVVSIGNMTVAIGGICKESFENADEYIRQRREQQTLPADSDATFTPLQEEIDACFCCPCNQLDVLTIARALDPWMKKATTLVHDKRFEEAAEILLFILEEIGNRFSPVCGNPKVGSLKDIYDICRAADQLLQYMQLGVSENLENHIASAYESLQLRFPFLKLGE